jgi:hypothetical protein
MSHLPNPEAEAAATDLRARIEAAFPNPNRPAVVIPDDYGHKLNVRVTDSESGHHLKIEDPNLLALQGLSTDERAANAFRAIYAWIDAGCPETV